MPRDLFERVQQRLNLMPCREQSRALTVDRASLVGKVFDASGEPMSPTHSRGRSGRIYRYYVSVRSSVAKRPGRSSSACLLRHLSPPSVAQSSACCRTKAFGS